MKNTTLDNLPTVTRHDVITPQERADQARRDADVAKGVELHLAAKKVFGDRWDSAGKTNPMIARELIAHLSPSIALGGKDDHFVMGACGPLLEQLRRDGPASPGSPVDAIDGAFARDLAACARADGGEPSEYDRAVAASRKADAEAWKNPRADRANGVAPGTVGKVTALPPDRTAEQETAPKVREKYIARGRNNANPSAPKAHPGVAGHTQGNEPGDFDHAEDDETAHEEAQRAMVQRDAEAWKKSRKDRR